MGKKHIMVILVSSEIKIIQMIIFEFENIYSASLQKNTL